MYAWLVLDGYSLLYADPFLTERKTRNFSASRQHLVRRIQPAADRLAQRVTVVFDGRSDAPEGTEFTFPGMDVLYSRQGESADAVIERLVSSARDPGTVLVVSSDRLILDLARAAGADTMSCRQLLEMADPGSSDLPAPRSRLRPGGAKLGEFFPDSPL